MIKAIETRYKGYRFRSRLEARWAVFFDAMGFQWEYEPEGFDLGHGYYYLPDFKIFGRDSNGDYNVFWLEVKPLESILSENESKKILIFAHACHDQGLTKGYGDFIMLDGPPRETTYMSCGAVVGGEEWPYQPRAWAMDIVWREGRPTFDFCDSNSDRQEYRDWAIDGFPDSFPNIEAINSARSARFEHGECG